MSLNRLLASVTAGAPDANGVPQDFSPETALLAFASFAGGARISTRMYRASSGRPVSSNSVQRGITTLFDDSVNIIPGSVVIRETTQAGALVEASVTLKNEPVSLPVEEFNRTFFQVGSAVATASGGAVNLYVHADTHKQYHAKRSGGRVTIAKAGMDDDEHELEALLRKHLNYQVATACASPLLSLSSAAFDRVKDQGTVFSYVHTPAEGAPSLEIGVTVAGCRNASGDTRRDVVLALCMTQNSPPLHLPTATIVETLSVPQTPVLPTDSEVATAAARFCTDVPDLDKIMAFYAAYGALNQGYFDELKRQAAASVCNIPVL